MDYGLDYEIPFGKYKGQKVEDIIKFGAGRDYMRWVVSQEVKEGKFKALNEARNKTWKELLSKYNDEDGKNKKQAAVNPEEPVTIEDMLKETKETVIQNNLANLRSRLSDLETRVSSLEKKPLQEEAIVSDQPWDE